MFQRGFSSIIVAIFIAIVALAVGGGYFTYQKFTADQVSKTCTQEAKPCSDGSYVSRTGPNCEFALCPSEALCEGGECPKEIVDQKKSEETPQDISDWKTYRNEKYGFEVRLPASWNAQETSSLISFFEKSDKATLTISKESVNTAFQLECVKAQEARCWVFFTESGFKGIVQYDLLGRHLSAEIKKSDIYFDFYHECLLVKVDSFGTSCAEEDMFEKIFSTFKFIK